MDGGKLYTVQRPECMECQGGDYAWGTVHGTVHKTVHGTVHKTVHGTVQRTVLGTVLGTVQGTVHGIVHVYCTCFRKLWHLHLEKK